MSHTPGPWTFTVENDDRYIRAGGESMMCDTPYYPYCPSGDANWHLIAAAPDLLDALKALFQDYKELADSGDAGFWSLEDRDVGKLALAAIAKAEGRP